MIASNVAGFTKKSVASAMMFMSYTAGNIIGPFLFFPSEAPEYSVGCLILNSSVRSRLILDFRVGSWRQQSASVSRRLSCSFCGSPLSVRTSDVISYSRTDLACRRRGNTLSYQTLLTGRISTSATCIKLNYADGRERKRPGCKTQLRILSYFCR
jgi:hypothetical protein